MTNLSCRRWTMKVWVWSWGWRVPWKRFRTDWNIYRAPHMDRYIHRTTCTLTSSPPYFLYRALWNHLKTLSNPLSWLVRLATPTYPSSPYTLQRQFNVCLFIPILPLLTGEWYVLFQWQWAYLATTPLWPAQSSVHCSHSCTWETTEGYRHKELLWFCVSTDKELYKWRKWDPFYCHVCVNCTIKSLSLLVKNKCGLH